MIILITGPSHVGKKCLSQKLLEKYKYPYLSIDHLKMGLIRSKQTNLTPLNDDKELTNYLWPIVCEMIKTAIENKQNLIVEGCYIPYNYKDYFDNNYLAYIKYYCLVMSRNYILNNFENIKNYANSIECRIDDNSFNIKDCLIENEYVFNQVKKYNLNYILIDKTYNIDIDI